MTKRGEKRKKPYNPQNETIRRRCQLLQEGWSEKKRFIRAGFTKEQTEERWFPPVIELGWLAFQDDPVNSEDLY